MVEISVILVAHTRRKFIYKAIESLLAQTISMDYFEVIVVKNFLDNEIDDKIKASGFVNMLSNRNDLSGKLLEGFKKSTGHIITVLEDDDYYSPKRLGKILSIFKSRQLCFYHNGFHFVDKQGAITGESNQVLPITLKNNSRNTLQLVRRAIHYKAYHNLSSMAFDRCMFHSALQRFGGINSGIDVLLFLLSLSSGRPLYLDPEKLTYYRRHESASNSVEKSPASQDINIKKDEELLGTMEGILKEGVSELVRKQVNLMILERSMYMAIKSSTFDPPFQLSFSRIFSLWLDKIHYLETEFIAISVLYFLSRFNRRLSTRLFVLMAKHRPRNIT